MQLTATLDTLISTRPEDATDAVVTSTSYTFAGDIDLDDVANQNKVILEVDGKRYVIRPDDDSMTSNGVSFNTTTGSWSITVDALANGAHSYKLITEDRAGNQSEQVSENFSVKSAILDSDLTYQLVGATPAGTDYATNDSTFDVKLSSASTTDIHVTATILQAGVAVAGIGSQSIDIASTDGNKTISFGSIGDTAGEYQIKLVITDNYGHSSTEYMTVDYDGTINDPMLDLVSESDTTSGANISGEENDYRTNDNNAKIKGIAGYRFNHYRLCKRCCC